MRFIRRVSGKTKISGRFKYYTYIQTLIRYHFLATGKSFSLFDYNVRSGTVLYRDASLNLFKLIYNTVYIYCKYDTQDDIYFKNIIFQVSFWYVASCVGLLKRDV